MDCVTLTRILPHTLYLADASTLFDLLFLYNVLGTVDGSGLDGNLLVCELIFQQESMCIEHQQHILQLYQDVTVQGFDASD